MPSVLALNCWLRISLAAADELPGTDNDVVSNGSKLAAPYNPKMVSAIQIVRTSARALMAAFDHVTNI